MTDRAPRLVFQSKEVSWGYLERTGVLKEREVKARGERCVDRDGGKGAQGRKEN